MSPRLQYLKSLKPNKKSVIWFVSFVWLDVTNQMN